MFRDFFFEIFASLPPDRRAFFIYDRRVDVNNLFIIIVLRAGCIAHASRLRTAFIHPPKPSDATSGRHIGGRGRTRYNIATTQRAQRLPQPVATTERETRHDGRMLARACKRRSALQRPRDRCRIDIDLASLHVSVGQVRPTEWLGRKVHTAVERV